MMVSTNGDQQQADDADAIPDPTEPGGALSKSVECGLPPVDAASWRIKPG
jgi:hypothetical protein